MAEILEQYRVTRHLKVKRVVREEHSFKQVRRGRPGPDTAYRKITRRRFDIEWSIDAAAVAYDQKSDGMYPLLSNDRTLTPPMLEAHKGQPTIEKRFEQVKTVHEIALIFLKNEGRIEALFTLYFLALLVQALIERELRGAMRHEVIAELPLYPEQRQCRRPTTEQVLRLFSLAQRHRLLRDGQTVQTFDADLTDLQRQVLALLEFPHTPTASARDAPAFRPRLRKFTPIASADVRNVSSGVAGRGHSERELQVVGPTRQDQPQPWWESSGLGHRGRQFEPARHRHAAQGRADRRMALRQRRCAGRRPRA
ncbi:MAG: hypothetical protein HS109_19265 [Burkholderiales bacterium]|nr:hypothetical protein [Burkholderiales bacterium]